VRATRRPAKRPAFRPVRRRWVRWSPPVRPHSRVAVQREFPPDRLAVRIADPRTGQTIARMAEDEHKTENIISGITKSGEMPGGHEASGGILPRDPRVDWPDTAPYLDYFLEGVGGEKVWGGRLDKAPESDGDRMVVEPKAVGHQKALDDRKGIIGPGFIDSDLSKWGEPSLARRVALSAALIKLLAATSVGSSAVDPKDPEAIKAAIVNDFNNVETVATDTEAGEAHYFTGVDIGAILYDALGDVAGGEASANWESNIALGTTDTFTTAVAGTDHDTSAALGQRVDATGPGFKHARLRNRLNVASEGTVLKRIFGWRPKVVGDHGLDLQGTWPYVGFTAKQMLAYAIPLYTYLTVNEEEMEDLGYVIQQAWFSEPGGMDAVVKELTKYELLDWFVMRDKQFELRVPGSYGRLWQAYAGPSELKETGEDGSRLWDRIVGRYTDVDGSTRTVGWPGSGANSESEALIITDPDHPAVRAEVTREDLLDLKGISIPERAIEACERWLADANELSHAGEATLRGYTQDDCSVFRPVSQIQPGDWIRFPDAGSSGTGYRKIVAVSYDHDSRTASVTLDAPPNAVEALLERLQAALQPLGLS